MKSRHTTRKVRIKLDGKELLLDVIGGIHAIASPAEQPTTDMKQWQIVLVIDDAGVRTRHLVGWADWEGRVSSAVKRWDWANRTATTGSGRIYRLVGESGFDRDADYVFERWLQINKTKAVRLSTGAAERLFAKQDKQAKPANQVPGPETQASLPTKTTRKARHV